MIDKPGMKDSAHRITMSLFFQPPRAIGLALVVLFIGLPARATDTSDGTGTKFLDSPKKVTGQFEVGLGWLILPSAEVCETDSCAQGDSTPLIEIWNLLHFDSGLAVGAGVTLGLSPTTTFAEEEDGVQRDHSRSYMTFEAVGRYYPLAQMDFDVWFGPGIGLAIITDRFVSDEGRSSQIRIGSPGFALRSEALSYFLAGGISYALSKRWHLGGAIRAGGFQLPSTPAQSPLGDEASLTGPTFYVFGGLSIAVQADL